MAKKAPVTSVHEQSEPLTEAPVSNFTRALQAIEAEDSKGVAVATFAEINKILEKNGL